MSDDLDEIVDNLREPSSWLRIIFMVGFVVVMYLIIAPLVLILMIAQALFSVLTGESNYNLRRFGKALTEYVQQILLYLSYNSHDKPFPFDDFPELEGDEEAASDSEVKPAAKSTAKAKKKTAKKAPRKAPKKAAAKKSASKKVGSKTEDASEEKTDDSSGNDSEPNKD